MKLCFCIMIFLFCSCTEKKVNAPAKPQKQILTVNKVEAESPVSHEVNELDLPERNGNKTQAKPISSVLDPLEKLENRNSTSVKEVPFKLLIDFDLPLEDQKLAAEEDLKALRESMPAAVRRLNKRIIKIKGFMVPLELNEQNKVSSFLFAPDQYSCCFGRIPDLNGFIYCTSEKGLPNLKDISLELTGYFKSEPEYNVFDDAVYLYTMKAHSYKELSLKIPLKGKGPDFDF